MPSSPGNALAAWQSIVTLVHSLTAGRTTAELDQRADAQSLSIREVAHHIAEANAVAASIVTAALGSPGSVYDWSWMIPNGAWM